MHILLTICEDSMQSNKSYINNLHTYDSFIYYIIHNESLWKSKHSILCNGNIISVIIEAKKWPANIKVDRLTCKDCKHIM